jgi:hypothetical protein
MSSSFVANKMKIKIHTATTLPVVLYGNKTLPPPLSLSLFHSKKKAGLGGSKIGWCGSYQGLKSRK